MSVELDHLVVGALELESGAAAVAARLGTPLLPGGVHPVMETHNRLLPLAERRYLEVISPIPDRPAERPRWFGLDDPGTRERLAAGPRLLAFAVRTDDIEALAARLPLSPGVATVMRRDALSWRITLTEDGLPPAGIVPALITWPAGVHPVDRMVAPEWRLARLVLRHPEPGFAAAVADALDLPHLEAAEGPVGIVATLVSGGREVILD